MTKTTKPRPGKARRDEDASLAGFMGSVIGLFTAYVIAEMALLGRPHPLHWLAAAGGAFLGYLTGKVVSRVRGQHL